MTSLAERLLVRPNDSLLVQMARYGVTGLVAFLVDFGLLVFLVEIFRVHYLLAAAGGFLAGLMTNYLISIRWVFSHRSVADQRVEFTVFAGVGVGGLALTEIVLWLGTDVLLFDYRISKIIAVIIVLAWNFGLRKALLFRNARPGHRA